MKSEALSSKSEIPAGRQAGIRISNVQMFKILVILNFGHLNFVFV